MFTKGQYVKPLPNRESSNGVKLKNIRVAKIVNIDTYYTWDHSKTILKIKLIEIDDNVKCFNAGIYSNYNNNKNGRFENSINSDYTVGSTLWVFDDSIYPVEYEETKKGESKSETNNFQLSTRRILALL